MLYFQPISPIKLTQDALLEANNVVDDWLEDDLGEIGASRPMKRRRKDELFVGQQLRSCGSSNKTVPNISRRISSSSSSDVPVCICSFYIFIFFFKFIKSCKLFENEFKKLRYF